MQRRCTLPAGTTLPPGRTLTLHTGRGTDQGLTRYWGLRLTLFHGDGVARVATYRDITVACDAWCSGRC